jgi:hypothetical protein
MQKENMFFLPFSIEIPISDWSLTYADKEFEAILRE